MSSLLPQASAASAYDAPMMNAKELVGHAVEIEGKGVGIVVACEKAGLFSDSLHRIIFVNGGEETLLLRRKKFGMWNRGVRFTMSESSDGHEAPQSASTCEAAAAAPHEMASVLPPTTSFSRKAREGPLKESLKEPLKGSLKGPLKGGCAEWITTKGRHFMLGDKVVLLRGLSWFGLETDTLVPHGLWERTLEEMLDEVVSLQCNLLRLPFCNTCLRAAPLPEAICADPSLRGLSCLDVIDRIVLGCRDRGVRVLLDRHRPTPHGQSPLWYSAADAEDAQRLPTNPLLDAPPGKSTRSNCRVSQRLESRGVSEATWIADWVGLARRYREEPTVIGGDLHNEPHGAASWGDGIEHTDWRLAAERCGNAILAVNPNWLVVVEGVEEACGAAYWWGGNLLGAVAAPVRLTVPGALVYSAHDYPPSVQPQPWFDAADFPLNLPAVWDDFWGSLLTLRGGTPVLLGEFGTFGVSEDDLAWLGGLTTYIEERELSCAFWCLGPNSGDTGGLLLDDWRSKHPTKVAVLKPLFAAAKRTTETQTEPRTRGGQAGRWEEPKARGGAGQHSGDFVF